MKKLSLLVTREQLDNFLGALTSLGCIQVSQPEKIPVGSDLYSSAGIEFLDLTSFGANEDSIEVLGTRYTVLITGWIPSRLENELLSMLKNYLCAWEIFDLTAADIDIAPVELKYPWFFKKYRLAGRELFTPLTADKYHAPETDENEEFDPDPASDTDFDEDDVDTDSADADSEDEDSEAADETDDDKAEREFT